MNTYTHMHTQCTHVHMHTQARRQEVWHACACRGGRLIGLQDCWGRGEGGLTFSHMKEGGGGGALTIRHQTRGIDQPPGYRPAYTHGTHTHIHTNSHTQCTHINTHAHVCMCIIHVCMCMHTCTHTFTHTQKYCWTANTL